MLSAEMVQKKIEHLHYWDSRATLLSCEYFASEVTLVFEPDDKLKFTWCYFTSFDHYWGDYGKNKPIRKWSFAQLPFFMEDVKVEIVQEYKLELYKFSIHMPPMKICIISKNLEINGVSVNSI